MIMIELTRVGRNARNYGRENNESNDEVNGPCIIIRHTRQVVGIFGVGEGKDADIALQFLHLFNCNVTFLPTLASLNLAATAVMDIMDRMKQ